MTLIGQKPASEFTKSLTGPPQTITDVIRTDHHANGHIFVSPFIKSQRVRALAVTSAARTPVPDIPTVAERVSGCSAFVVGNHGSGRRLKSMLQRLHAEMKNVLGTQQMRERLEQLGMTIRANT
jgi:tripartite-type tricarboxylate transporter receptor subunit TctC